MQDGGLEASEGGSPGFVGGGQGGGYVALWSPVALLECDETGMGPSGVCVPKLAASPLGSLQEVEVFDSARDRLWEAGGTKSGAYIQTALNRSLVHGQGKVMISPDGLAWHRLFFLLPQGSD